VVRCTKILRRPHSDPATSLPSPFILSLSRSCYLFPSYLVTPFYPSFPRLRSVLRGKLLRGASLFWLPYFTDSDLPPPRYLPFYPFSPLSPYPPFRAAPPASPESLLSLHFAPSCSPQCVTLSLIQHVVPARQRNAPRSLIIPQPSTFLPRSSSFPVPFSPCALAKDTFRVRLCEFVLISICALRG